MREMRQSTEQKFINIAAIIAFLVILGAAWAVYGGQY